MRSRGGVYKRTDRGRQRGENNKDRTEGVRRSEELKEWQWDLREGGIQ